VTDRGLSVANELVNIRLAGRYTDKAHLASIRQMADAATLFESHLFHETRRLYAQLQGVCMDLKSSLDQMAAVSRNLEDLADEETSDIFLGVGVNDYAKSSTRLAQLYKREHTVRETICKSMLSPNHSRGSFMLLLTTWMTEPYVDNESHVRRFVLEVSRGVAG